MSGEQQTEVWHMQRLEWSLQALAQSASDQIAMFPDFVVAADELASDFNDALLLLRASSAEWSREQRESVDLLSDLLTGMSGKHEPDLWSHEALNSSPEWVEVRRLAVAALAAFGWSEGLPPGDRAVYVKSQ
jgi:hypothetical protein